jgi:hypothetical protein
LVRIDGSRVIILTTFSVYKDGLHGMQENKDENGTVVKWVDKKAIHSMGLTSGVRKVYIGICFLLLFIKLIYYKC